MRCKALKPTSDSRLQDFLGTLQSFEAYLRFQPALIFPLAASRQLRRALTIRYRDSSVDSNIPGTSLDQGGSQSQRSLNHYSLLHRCRKAFEGPESKGPKNPWSKKGVQPVTGMGVAGSVIRMEGGLAENSDSIPGRPADDNASVAAHSSGSAAKDSDHIADSPSPVQALSTEQGKVLGQF